jgi:hypothetical protein
VRDAATYGEYCLDQNRISIPVILLTVSRVATGTYYLANYAVARRVEPEAKFFNAFYARACAQGQVGSESKIRIGRRPGGDCHNERSQHRYRERAYNADGDLPSPVSFYSAATAPI